MKKITKNTLKKLSCNTLISTALISNLILTPALATENTMTPAQTAFRNAFIGGMPKEASKAQRMDLLYPITPAIPALSSNIENGEDEVTFFDQLRSSVPTPETFSKQSKETEYSKLSDTEITEQISRLNLNDNKELPLIILAPGIFGEFIVAHPFQDVLDDNNGIKSPPSIYKTDFLSKLQQAEGSDLAEYSTDLRLELSNTTFDNYLNAIKESKNVQNNALVNLGRKQTKLSELVLVGALKNEDGKIVANTLTLDTKALSLESLGALRSNAKMFNRRLSKFFKIMGHIPSNIILEGYSRGTPVALDMLALGSKKECSDFTDETSDTFLEHGCLRLDGKVLNWTKNVKSFLSVAGVIYGSEIADQGFGVPVKSDPNAEVVAANNSEDSKVYKQVQALKKLVNISQVGSLLDGDGFIDKAILDTESINLSLVSNFINQIRNNNFSDLKKVFGKFSETVDNSGILLMPKFKPLNSLKNTLYNLIVPYIAYNNTTKWIEFLITMAEIQAPDISKNLTDILNEIKKHPFNYDALKAQYKKIKEQQEKLLVTYQINRRINLNEAVVQGINLLKSAFGDVNYNNNILQFATLAKETIDAAKDLTSKSRFDWWKHHTIPTDEIKYYSVSATMKKEDNIDISEDTNNVAFYSYNSRTPDFQSLKDGFETFLKIGNFNINDSQVTILKSSFFPQIADKLNSNQKPYKAESLGLFHTHHWGLTLMAVTKVRDDNTAAKREDPNFNSSIEPFPRKALLRATLAAIAEDTNR